MVRHRQMPNGVNELSIWMNKQFFQDEWMVFIRMKKEYGIQTTLNYNETVGLKKAVELLQSAV